jgi:hypothetical protein
MKDGSGEHDRWMDDGFHTHARPAIEWVLQLIPEKELGGLSDAAKVAVRLEQIEKRAHLFKMAVVAYQKASGSKNLEALRLEPYVSSNYTPSPESAWGHHELWFFFKEDNNGTTYKIRHVP